MIIIIYTTFIGKCHYPVPGTIPGRDLVQHAGSQQCGASWLRMVVDANKHGLLTYRIKVINYCKCSIIDIRGELSYVTISPNNGRIVTKQIHLNKSNL